MGFVSLLMGNKNLIIGIVLLALLAGLGIYIKILKSEVATAKAEVSVLTSQLEVSQASVKGLQASIVNQNTAIAKLKEDADARVALHQVEIAAATKTANSFRLQAQNLMNRKPPPPVNVCAATDALINEEIGK
jgi:hypothetical protein